MARHLLLVVLICFFYGFKVQALSPPKLTVDPPVITETDSVTLKCWTPPSVSTAQCFFYTLRGKTVESVSCQHNQTLTGSELLLMAGKSSPAEVQITCYYTVKFGTTNSRSPHSDTFSIFIETLHPLLTVDPPVITEKATVTLNCQTPSSVSVSECFYIIGEKPAKQFSCLKKLTGSELLSIVNQSPPAEINVECFYLQTSAPLHSDSFSITVQSLHPPTLFIDPPVISETDTVTLKCRTPPSVSATQCFFYTLRGKTVKSVSCQQNRTLTGSELLSIAGKSSPAEVQIKCYYTVKFGTTNSRSPHSDTFSIFIKGAPLLTVDPPVITETDSVTLNCQTPSSVSVSRCHFYTVSGIQVAESSCVKTLRGADLMLIEKQSPPVKIELKCFYSVKRGEALFQSSHSSTSSIYIQSVKTAKLTTFIPNPAVGGNGKDFTETKTSLMQTKLTFTPSTDPNVRNAATEGTSVSKTTLKKPAETKTSVWKSIPFVAGCGIGVGGILLFSALLCNKKPGSQAANRQEFQQQNSIIYHTYETIPEEAVASALQPVLYSTVGKH